MLRKASIRRSRPPPGPRCRLRAPGPSVTRSSPLAITWQRSAAATVRCARCSTSSTPRPRSRIAARAPNTTSTIEGARPSDGSSSSSTSGSATRARAIASCCCWPPESTPAWRLRNSSTTGNSSYTLRNTASWPPRRPRRAASPRRKFSSTVSSAKIRRPSGTSATPSRATSSGRRPSSETSPSRTSPLAGATPMIACSVEDFPAPLAPIRPTISPGATWNESPRTAWTPP